jgi:lipopolysaccharide transport system permease protein
MRPAPAADTGVEIEITPENALRTGWHDLVAFRELLYFLVWRDVKVRYKQTAIGAAWAILQPLAMVVTFTIVFGRVAHVSSGGVEYAVFSYSGLLFWNLFSGALASSSNSLLANQAMVTKVYFPRLLVPLAATAVAVVDFGFALVVGVVLFAYYGVVPGGLGLVLLLPMLVLTFVTAAGGGLFLAALNVRYRDVKYVLPFFTQLLLFLTPVVYPVTSVPGGWRWLLYLDPMTAVVSVMRAGLLHQGTIEWGLVGLSTAVSLALAAGGVAWFNRQSPRFADVI